MSKTLEIAAWIEEAASIKNPLVYQVGKGIYKTYAKEVLIKPSGDIFPKDSLIKYMGVDVEVSTDIPTWDVTDREINKAIRKGLVFEPKVKHVIIPEVEEEIQPEGMVVPDFSPMTKKEIDEWALANGIEVDGRKSKKDMIETIEATIK